MEQLGYVNFFYILDLTPLINGQNVHQLKQSEAMVIQLVYILSVQKKYSNAAIVVNMRRENPYYGETWGI